MLELATTAVTNGVQLVALAAVLGRPLPARWAATLLAVVLGLTAAREAVAFGREPLQHGVIDLRLFRAFGADAAAGRNPYRADDFIARAALNPPSAVPLFMGLAALPPRTAAVGWLAVNYLLSAVLPLVAARVVAPSLPVSTRLVLAAALVTCSATTYNARLGQMSTLTAAALVGAVAVRDRSRVAAGLLLAVGTVKVGTMLPFLLLFAARRWWPVWAALAAGTLGLCLLGTPTTELLPRCGDLLARIKDLSQPGNTNDYSHAGRVHTSIVGFDHALYNLGLRDRGLIAGLQFAGLIALGLWLAWAVRRVPAGAAAGLVACYSFLFLYHRHYDAVVLVLPLASAAGRLADRPAAGVWPLRLCVVCCFAALNSKSGLTKLVFDWSLDQGGLGAVARAVVLPLATWLTLAALFNLYLGERRARLSGPAAGA